MRLFLLNLLLASLLPSIASGQDSSSSSCSAEQDAFCADQANRICALNANNNNNPECTDCVANAVMFKAGCIPLDEIELFAYLEEFQVDYRTSVSREDRWALLLNSLAFISEYQANNPTRTYELGLTPVSADSVEDMKHRTGLSADLYFSPATDVFQTFSFNASNPVPSKVNWIDAGAVTDVKDQGRCGCSWAIATAGAIEGAAAVAGTALQSLSHQQLISCDTVTNLACEGGDIAAATASVIEYGGLMTLASYPYTDEQGVATTRCYASKYDIAVDVTAGTVVLEYNSLLSLEKRMEKMKQAVSIQPVAIGISTGCPTFANYVSGVLTNDGDCFCADSTCVDHAVLLVGYNDEAPIPYWIIKNSWSTEWGEGGYARIAQSDSGSLYGLFGIMTYGVSIDVNVELKPREVKTQAVEEDSVLEWWHILLIVIGSILVLCCLFWTCANCIAPEPHHEKA